MTTWPLILMGGFLGSSHCIGMCGPFAAMIGMHHRSYSRNLQAQLIYSAGRLISYATLGGIAGYSGQRLLQTLPQLVSLPAILCILAGLLLVREGLLASGILRRGVSGKSTSGCLLKPLFSTILKTPGMRNTFVAGLMTGLLPCGLVYSFVSLAGASGDLLQGGFIMLMFGLGTIPWMVIAGCGISALSLKTQQKLWKAAAWSVIFTGGLTIWRGGAFLMAEAPPQESCPFCSSVKMERAEWPKPIVSEKY